MRKRNELTRKKGEREAGREMKCCDISVSWELSPHEEQLVAFSSLERHIHVMPGNQRDAAGVCTEHTEKVSQGYP